MSKITAQALALRKTKGLIFISLLAIASIIPAFLHSQWITGPLVNAALILTCVLVGPTEAVILGLVPSTVALSTGLLPFPLAPMVPFIMIGNAILVLSFHYLGKQNFLLRLSLGAFLKFIFLHFSVSLIVSTMLRSELATKLSIMMSWPQFYTAMIGGIAVYGILKGLKKV